MPSGGEKFLSLKPRYTDIAPTLRRWKEESNSTSDKLFEELLTLQSVSACFRHFCVVLCRVQKSVSNFQKKDKSEL